MTPELPRRQRQLYALLFGKGDVPIDQLHHDMHGTPVAATMADKQRRLTPYITMLNRSLAPYDMKVEPGALKNTYRLVAVSK